jgi:hypothetical protein
MMAFGKARYILSRLSISCTYDLRPAGDVIGFYGRIVRQLG